MQGGPTPKPKALRQRRNKSTEISVLPPGRHIEKPPIPTGMCDKVTTQWNEFWESPLATTIERTDWPDLERLFYLRDEWERTMVEVRRTPPPPPTRKKNEDHNDFQHRYGQWKLQVMAVGRLVPSPKGGVQLNPLLRYLESLSKQVTALSDRFGFNLITRQRLGLNDLHARTLAQQNALLFQGGDEDDEDDDPTASLAAVQLPATDARRKKTS